MTDLISKHGGYKNLKSFQMAKIVSDLNFQFCQKYVPSLKMRDQMEGAARGTTQNIGEGSKTSGTSKQSELRLIQVARASLEELKLDYESFLSQRNLKFWGKNDLRSAEIRSLAYKENKNYKIYEKYLGNQESAANCMLCLINQTGFLLDRQLRVLESELARGGDYKERYKQVRKEQMFGGYGDEELEKYIKELGKKRLKNGRIVDENSTEVE